ncbi:GATA transcription factor 16 [Micractinium conductrix]|uniref:GATA transcription factor 16 n=1 Tax=Micractinium conductrix TaxID=554055 RepID=A0A2P6VRB7_9CHLO|nr:GATA transcription factor 16 [Micractinium conductrix]|eukprot:PSC76646.1 GATA transcription factor 16 [Micractinium conductrix]
MAQSFAAAALAAVVAPPLDFGVPAPADCVLEDEEFPYASGALNGVKCCTKCGATKTPQWREGPFGPKTLCNACGVKRTRKLRAEQEGAKRRKLSASPVPPHKHLSTKSRAAHDRAAAMDSHGSLEFDFEAWGIPAAPPAGNRRPQRRAAEEAAVRTARYARTGEWAGEGGDAGMDEEELRAATPSSSSDCSLPSSNCPEEVSWPPAAGPAGDCYAAINLMTMSARQQQAAAAAAAAPPAPLARPALAAASGAASPVSASLAPAHSLTDPEQYNHDSLAALAARVGGAAHHDQPHKVMPVDLSELSQCLPPAKVLELVRLNQALECSVHEAHAANAAVAAVAQVLASKQAAALRAREAAGAATKRLRRFMAELDTQFGIQSKLSSRPAPLSPCKPAGLASPCVPSVLPSAAPLSPVAPLMAPQLLAAPALEGCSL